MAKGDHIYVWKAGYTHHGIDCGNGKIIHYISKVDQKTGMAIKQTTLEKFTEGAKVYVQEYNSCNPPDLVVKYANSRLNETKYNLVFNNCEHFATWCKIGKHESKQVSENAKNIGEGIGEAIGKMFGG